MKKTLATLLVLAMVVSVCGMLFASAGANNAVAELKAELEALVGADVENAAGEWNIDVTVDETGKVTAVFNIVGLEGKEIVVVEAPVFYDAEKLTLLNAINSKDNTVDCITVLPDDSGDWESLCRVESDDAGTRVVLSIVNVEAVNYVNDTNLVFTLEFQLAEGENLAGLYIPTNSDNYVCDGVVFEPLDVNGAYGIVCTIVEEPHEHVYAEEVTAKPTLSAEGVITYTCECGDTYTKAIPAVKVQPETLEALPEGALVFDYAGYVHDSFFCIVAGDNLTVNDLTALGNNGSGKDMNYFYVAVVDEDDVVVETYFTLGRPDGVKSDVVCPAGGYIISFNANKAGADEMLNIEVGAKITLYNIDVEALRGVAGNVAVKDAGFVFANPVEEPERPVEPEVAVPAEPGNLAAGKEWTGDTEIGTSYAGDITDGKIDTEGKYDQTIWYGFDQRKSGDSVGTIIIDLGKLYSGLDEIRAHVWPAAHSGIAAPVSYDFYISEDGETYTLVTSVAGAASDPLWVGTDNTETLTARYVKLDIVGTTADTFWFIGELEVNVYEDAPDEPEQPVEPEIEGNKITISHVNAYTWGVFYEMIITGEGQNCVTKLGYDCTWWIAIKVDNVDGVYTVTAIEGNGTAKEMTASADGFIVYCYSNDAESFAAAQAIKVGDTMAACTVDWSQGAASETPIGYLVFVEGEEPEEPDQPEEPDVSEEPSEEPSEDPSEEPSEEPEEPSEGPITWEDTLVKGENGNYTVDVPYDYIWNVTYVDGKIVGEDITICTTDEAYKASNPNWAITILLEKQADGTYVAVQDAVVTPGNADKVTVGENQIALVVHSSASNDSNPAYHNWTGKVVAMSVKAGQVFEVAEDLSSVKAANPNAVAGPDEVPDEPSEEPSEDDSSELPPTSDAGVLVFAILGILAIAGAAVVIKVRS